MQSAFDGSGEGWGADNLYRPHQVGRSFIQVDADEVTYPAHVILRYRLERAMIDGDLQPKDLPGAWQDQMKQLLGISPPDDRRGCLQDIHWYDGAWGYFPTYSSKAWPPRNYSPRRGKRYRYRGRFRPRRLYTIDALGFEQTCII